MVAVDIDRAIALAQSYINSGSVRTPFFLAFNSKSDLVQLRNRLSVCQTVRLSAFCSTSDSTVDEDRLADAIAKANDKAIILLGIGEYCGLTNDDVIVDRLFDLIPVKAKVVVPLWSGHEKLEKICGADPRLWERRCVCLPQKDKHWRVRVYKEGLNSTPDASGFRALVRRLEDGCDGLVNATTSVALNPRWSVKIESAYDIYKANHPESVLRKSFCSDAQWKTLLDEGRDKSDSIDSIDQCVALFEGTTDNRYLQLVMASTERFSAWKHNLMTSILSVDASNAAFWDYYDERRKVIAGFDEEAIGEYVRETRRFTDPEKQLCYLTDMTPVERDEILKILGKSPSVPVNLRRVYPQLWDYMREFKFADGEFSGDLTSYFTEYKRQKIVNQIAPVFKGVVREVAAGRPQFLLPTRESVLENLYGANTCLFWVDALGCEWLGYIQASAERLGMKLRVTPTRAILPTITSVNRGFYDEWKGEKHQPVKALDKIKHGDFERGASACKDVPVHLSEELSVLSCVMKDVHAWLKKHLRGKVVLTSDHGATRLAVISDDCTIWEMPEKGKHGGRCCKVSEFDGNLPVCSTTSDDGAWHVLAGHDRFKGGRVGDVEVHGGATLEEMVVPVIEIESLDPSVSVELIERAYKVTYRDAEVCLRAFSPVKLNNAELEFRGKRYGIEFEGEGGHCSIRIPKPTAGEYVADVYEGDTKIGSVAFSVVSGGVTINKMDDFF